jgi:flagellar biosynthesis protein FlhB
MGDSGGDKTEEPTPHKLRDARKKGQIVKSKEVTTAFLFLFSYNVLKSSAPKIWKGINEYLFQAYSYIPLDLEVIHYGILLKKGMTAMLLMLAPLMLTNMGIAIALESLQTGFLVTGEPIKPKLSKLNPIEGFKRMFSMKGLVELAKSIAKMGIIFFIVQKAVLPALPTIQNLGNIAIIDALAFVGKLALTVAIRVGLFYLFIALMDYFYQRHAFMKQMRMTKQEVKDEYKKLEGDPQIKQRQRDMARQMSQGGGRGGAAGADAVVTNPTHIAIAIKYDPDVMNAPQIVDKGKMLIAAEIKRLADENGVYILERPELAWALYDSTDIGGEVPSDLYSAVAEVLAMVFEIRKKRQQVKDSASKTST